MEYIFAGLILSLVAFIALTVKRARKQSKQSKRIRVETSIEEAREFARLYDEWNNDQNSATKRLNCLIYGRELVNKFSKEKGMADKRMWKYDTHNCYLECWETPED